MIICNSLTKLFDEDSGINNIQLEFIPGLIYGLVGSNGAGKTTLLRCIEGLYYPDNGIVSHDGVDTTDDRKYPSLRSRIAYLPTEDYLYKKLTCNENILLATLLKTGRKEISSSTLSLIKYFNTESFLNKRFMDCSTGMKKKVQIIISLIGEIDSIIWDEPNDGLDIISNIKLKELLKKYKKNNTTIIISSHVIEFLDDFIDKCIFIDKGRIASIDDVVSGTSLSNLFLKYTLENNITLPEI